MKTPDFSQREIDNKSVANNKKATWLLMQQKINQTNQNHMENLTFREKLSAFFTKRRLVLVPAIAGTLVLALVIQQVFFGSDIGIFDSPTAHANFEMTATNEDSTGVPSDEKFILRSSEDFSEGVIAENLQVEPQTKLEIEKIGNGEYEVSVAEGLKENKIYNFTIEGAIAADNYSWAYQVRNEFKLSGSLPGDKTSYVPVNTGIEFYFSHENFELADVEKSFSITPAVAGKFEKHLRTVVFVPSEPLKQNTLYTVTLKQGVKLLNSEQTMKEDMSFSFSTSGEEADYSGVAASIQFAEKYYEMKTNQPFGLRVYDSGYFSDTQTAVKMSIYKFASTDDFMAAWQTRLKVPKWSSLYYDAGFDIQREKLAAIGKFEAKVSNAGYQMYLYLPDQVLEPGYYFVEIDDAGGRIGGKQTLLQVTDTAIYTHLTKTKSLVWVADLKALQPIKNAQVTFSNFEQKIETDEQGLAVFDSPDEWNKNIVDNNFSEIELMKVAVEGRPDLITQIDPANYDSIDQNYRFYFTQDRTTYQPKDVVKFWGYISPKDNSSLKNVTIELSDFDTVIWSKGIALDDKKFMSEVTLPNLTPGGYTLNIKVGEDVLRSSFIDVTEYKKPTYGLEISAEKNYVMEGEDFVFALKSAFFDGTPMPNLRVAYTSIDFNEGSEVKTDVNGLAKIIVKAKKADCIEQCPLVENKSFSFNPILAEESGISNRLDVNILTSKLNIGSESEVKNGQALIKFKTNYIDIEKLNSNSTQAMFNEGPVAGNKTLEIKVKKISWIQVEDGEYYDLIDKVVKKRYNYEMKEEDFKTDSLITNANGQAEYSFDLAEDDKANYNIYAISTDDEGRKSYHSQYVSNGYNNGYGNDYYHLKIVNPKENDELRFDFGENVDLEIMQNDKAVEFKPEDKASDFMFLQLNNGLQDYSLNKEPKYSFKFAEKNFPSTNIKAVWLGKNGFIATEYSDSAYYDTKLNTLKVELEADKESYVPGEKVKLKVKVTDSKDNPVEAEVLVNLVDEAYYNLFAASINDPITSLIGYQNEGTLYQYLSHKNSNFAYVMRGDFGGGGAGDMANEAKLSSTVRSDFKDTASFVTLTTNGSGEAEYSFTLPDNVTSWRASMIAINGDKLLGGVGTGTVRVSLPLFTDVVINSEYSVKDKPKLKLRTFGEKLKQDDQIQYEVKSSLVAGDDNAWEKFTSLASEFINYPLPQLKVGEHTIDVKASNGSLEDGVREQFEVKGSRLTQAKTVFIDLLQNGSELPVGTDSATEIIITDSGLGAYLYQLAGFLDVRGERIDQKVTSKVALNLLNEYFPESRELALLNLEDGFGISYQDPNGGGLMLLPYGSPDLKLSMLLALIDEGDSFDKSKLSKYFYTLFKDKNSNYEDVFMAVVGLSALDEPMLNTLRQLEITSLDQAVLAALAYEALGSKADAKKILVGTKNADYLVPAEVKPESAETMALGAIAMAGLNLETKELWKTIESIGMTDKYFDLYRLAYVKKQLPFVNPNPAVFKINGKKVELKNGESHVLRVQPGTKVSIDEIDSGQIVAVAKYSDSMEPSEIKGDSRIKVTRSYEVDGKSTKAFKEGDLVKVTIDVEIDPTLAKEGFLIRDILPSGLRAVTQPQPPIYYFRGDINTVITTPIRISGQAVDFLWTDFRVSTDNAKILPFPPSNEPLQTNKKFTYHAMVVNQGEFYADPTKVEGLSLDNLIQISTPDTVTIN